MTSGAPPKVLRGAIIGYGFISERGHVPAYALPGPTRFEIVAVADTCAARREKARSALPGVRVYESHEQLLRAEKGHIDFVDVTTPPCDHAQVARDALSRGLHVLCEKPLATTAADARAMAIHAREMRRVIFPCHNYKHAPVIKAVRKILDAGLIGPAKLVTLQTFRNTHAKGVEEWRRDWRRENRFSGGGIAMDHGSHTFYLAFEWLRAYPTSVTARAATLGTFPSDTEDDFTCSLKFPTGVASAHLSWNAGVRKVLYTIHGEQGAVRVEDDAIEVATQMPDPKGGPGDVTWKFDRESIPSDWMDSSHVTWFNSLFDDFKGAIARGDFVGQDARESFLCVQLIATAYASARAGSRELPLPGLAALEGDDVSDRLARRANRKGARDISP
jgi:predicted dehydrogenase